MRIAIPRLSRVGTFELGSRVAGAGLNTPAFASRLLCTRDATYDIEFEFMSVTRSGPSGSSLNIGNFVVLDSKSRQNIRLDII